MSETLSLLREYAAWTATIWTGGPVMHTRDFAVMSLGIAGECGEVAEALLAATPSRVAVTKELGDVLYYWGRLCEALALRVDQAWPAEGASLPRAEPLALCLAGARVAEAMKKRIRGDGGGDPAAEAASRLKVQDSLRDLALVWLSVCTASGLTVAEVVKSNMEKLNDRKQRNVLRGTGDER